MNYAPEFIGVGKYTSELAAYLAERGHKVEVVAALPHYPGWKVQSRRPWRVHVRQEGDIRVTRCPLLARPGGRIWRLIAPLSFALLAAPIVVWRAWRSRPHIVLCIEPTLLAAPAALIASRLVGARTVLHVQDLELEAACATGYLGRFKPALTWARLFERAVRSRFDVVVTISDAMAARLRTQVSPRPVEVLRNWVDTGRLRPDVGSAEMRASLNIPAAGKLVLYAGNLGAKQGLSVLIDAARHLRADPSIHMLIVGDGVMAAPLRAAAAGLPNLHFAGLRPPEQLGSLLAAADLHLLPQDKAASDLVFPSKLGPILNTGRPLVVTAEPSSELALWLGDAAYLAPPGDGDALAAAIKRGLERSAPDPERATALCRSLDAASILPKFELTLTRHHPVEDPRRLAVPSSSPEPVPAALA